MSFRLRLRLPSSKQETLTLPSPVTIRALLDSIAPLLNTDPQQIELRTTYPPKSIDLGPEDTWTRDIRTVGIQNGEGLIVSLRAPTTAPEEEAQTVVPAKEEEPVRPSELVKPSVPVAQTSRGVPAQRALRSSPLARVSKDEPPEIQVEGGTVILRIMEDDNSCMFSPLQYLD
jgi:ubiquitin thioesterase OTU1